MVENTRLSLGLIDQGCRFHSSAGSCRPTPFTFAPHIRTPELHSYVDVKEKSHAERRGNRSSNIGRTHQGVRGGHPGPPAATYKIDRDGNETKLPGVVECVLEPGEWIRGVDTGGGGYGDPLERDPARVCRDVSEYWETAERAREIYGVVLSQEGEFGEFAVDLAATVVLRAKMRDSAAAR